MLSKLRSQLTYANTLSTVSLFIVLGGTSYAVATGSIDSREIKNNTVRSKDIRNNTVRSKDIRNNQVGSRDVRNFSLLSKDFKPGQLPTGATGPRGPQGSPGPFTDTLPSGKTLWGVWKLGATNEDATGGDSAYGDISFGFMLASAPSSHTIKQADLATPECGTFVNPAPAPGQLCVYVAGADDTTLPEPAVNAASNVAKFGARLGISADNALSAGADFSMEGFWAVTAP